MARRVSTSNRRISAPSQREQLGAAKTAQIKFRLPNYLRDLVDGAADQNGWGASEEIRRRLDRSFHHEIVAGDDKSARLVDAIETVARNISPAFGPWHRNRFAFDTFRAAVLTLIDLHRPSGSPIRPADNEIADMYLGDDGTPETAGRVLAGSAAVAVNIPMPGQRPGRR